jgi:site-specific DNA-methyltransferase (adenine-specific)
LLERNKIYLGDCLEVMKDIPDKSIDMILCDLPYGTTACKWDTVIPFEPLWVQYERVIKDSGAIVLTASQPFASALVMSNLRLFKHEWCWDKVNSSSGLHAKRQPLKSHENILVFGKYVINYFPQKEEAKRRVDKERDIPNGEAFNCKTVKRVYDNNGLKYPKSVLRISNASQQGKVHPTQKPIALFEYLIRTYTNKGDTVLDNCIGSGTTAVACINTNRFFIGIEKDENYFNIAQKRLNEAQWSLLG